MYSVLQVFKSLFSSQLKNVIFFPAATNQKFLNFLEIVPLKNKKILLGIWLIVIFFHNQETLAV